MQRNDDMQRRLAAVESKQKHTGRFARAVLILGVLGWSASVAAQESWVPDDFNFFEAGAPAVASEVNHNFRRVLEEVRVAVPAGTVAAFAGQTPPAGWLLCNGEEVSSSEYPELATALGTTWGEPLAGGVVLPDLRGQFLRGAGESAADPMSPRTVGSAQLDALQNIEGVLPEVATNTFSFSELFSEEGRHGYTELNRSDDSDADAMVSFRFDASRVVRADEETRPVNVAVHYIIKY